MSDNRVLQTTQYTVKPNGLSLATKLGVIDLTGMFEELNIFDSVFNPCMTGTIQFNGNVFKYANNECAIKHMRTSS